MNINNLITCLKTFIQISKRDRSVVDGWFKGIKVYCYKIICKFYLFRMNFNEYLTLYPLAFIPISILRY